LDLNVVAVTQIFYDFTRDFCAATWSSQLVYGLECPTSALPGSNGWVGIDLQPILEDGRIENEPALIVAPSDGSGGYISGFYPPIRGDAKLEKAAARYAGEKGNLRFPFAEPIPYALIASLTKLRARQDAAKAVSRPRARRQLGPSTLIAVGTFTERLGTKRSASRMGAPAILPKAGSADPGSPRRGRCPGCVP
jgi:hypothetical protein